MATPNNQTDRRIFALCCFIGFILFCGLIKWQPWHTRLHLPLLMLWAVPVAAVVPIGLRRALMGLLVGYAVFTLLIAPDRGVVAWLTPRVYREYEVYYMVTAERIRATGCTLVRFDVGINEPEYLLHRALPEATFTHEGEACAVVKNWYESE